MVVRGAYGIDVGVGLLEHRAVGQLEARALAQLELELLVLCVSAAVVVASLSATRPEEGEERRLGRTILEACTTLRSASVAASCCLSAGI